MRRSLATLMVIVALAAWVNAAGTSPPLPAATQEKFFKSNRALIGSLVDHGIDLVAADSPLQRADECRKTTSTLAKYLSEAAADQDADRVVELAGLMGNVVREGLVPNLNAAQKETRPGSPGEAQLAKVRKIAAEELDSLSSRIPAEGKVGDSQKVKEAIAALESLKGSLGKP